MMHNAQGPWGSDFMESWVEVRLELLSFYSLEGGRDKFP